MLICLEFCSDIAWTWYGDTDFGTASFLSVVLPDTLRSVLILRRVFKLSGKYPNILTRAESHEISNVKPMLCTRPSNFYRSFVAPLLASRVFFASTVDTAQGLKNVQWTYLGVAGFVALLVILFYVAPMPEITDADMGTQELEIADYNPGPLKKQINLFLAVWSQFCYIGAQGKLLCLFYVPADQSQYPLPTTL